MRRRALRIRTETRPAHSLQQKLALNLCMCRLCLNDRRSTRHEINNDPPTRVRCLRRLDDHRSICPIFVGPEPNRSHATILGEWEFWITTMDTELANPDEFDAHSGGCACANPFAKGPPPIQLDGTIFD